MSVRVIPPHELAELTGDHAAVDNFAPELWSPSGVRASGNRMAKQSLLQINAPSGGVAWVIFSDRRPGDATQALRDQHMVAAAPWLYRALKSGDAGEVRDAISMAEKGHL